MKPRIWILTPGSKLCSPRPSNEANIERVTSGQFVRLEDYTKETRSLNRVIMLLRNCVNHNKTEIEEIHE